MHGGAARRFRCVRERILRAARRSRRNRSGFRLLPGRGAQIHLAAIPPPELSIALPAPNTIDVLVDPPTISAGLYQDSTCLDPGLVGYRVYRQEVAVGAPPPTDRNPAAGWVAVAPVTDFSEQTLLVVDCAAGFDVFLATALVTDSGFETPFLSANALRISCDPACRGVDADADGFCTDSDCDDASPATYPGAPELCDGRNNDCDDAAWPSPLPDEIDGDGDGAYLCSGECDDGEVTVYPGAPEICDGLNNDCDDPDWPATEPPISTRMRTACRSAPATAMIRGRPPIRVRRSCATRSTTTATA